MVKKVLKELLHKKFKEWSSETSYHGIPKIMSEKSKIRRFMWALFFIASLFGCIFVTATSLIDYYKYKTSISINHYQDSQTTLPAITICNMNPFKIDQVGEYFKENPLGNELYDGCIKNITNNWHNRCFKKNETHILNYYIRSFRGLLANNKSLAVNRSKYSFNLKEDMLLSCLYNLQPCSADNFTEFWSNVYGNCYTFGDGKNNPVLKSSGTGSFLGLILEMFVCKSIVH